MLSHDIYDDAGMPSPLSRALAEFRKHPIYMAAFYWLLLMAVLSLFAPLIAPYSADEQHLGQLLVPPSWYKEGQVEFFFGTDDLGRDVLSRLIYGARYSFGSSLLVVMVCALAGIIIGVFAGMTRGLKSSVLHHILDTILSIPSLLLAIVVIAILGSGLEQVLIAIGLAQIPQFIRTVNNAIRQEMSKVYVTAATLDGEKGARLFLFTLLPNLIEPIMVQFTISLSTAILDIAALGFLKLGAQAPSPEWGTMLSGGLELIYRAPWTVAFPGFAILICVLSVNVVGEGFRNSISKAKS
ncbi:MULTISPECIES: ABC transporter permease subunit [Corallincola]|uniref:ABC transporter permease subunit n=3 Tax=Corallincola TaxID=1775176 RepID=A0A368N317_9GAMM|nr:MULTISPECIES: ABC transporter permease subunit [Corallincola]RCU43659.1 ABC transporter permease subunit [Corallincola holothuriorum]TAA42736.1 ABC transporter permease subunit [Corallincola spongiicola]TCI01613.1 ABC transporter permease subunit [Corallincola luteus]